MWWPSLNIICFYMKIIAQIDWLSVSVGVDINDKSTGNVSYHFAINCYICQQHFDAFGQYQDHIKAHYNNDPNETWTECEFGCKTISKGDQSFIGHIATHSNTKPFHCDVLIDGVKCTASLSRKSFLKDHWKRHFPQDLDDNYKPKNEQKHL